MYVLGLSIVATFDDRAHSRRLPACQSTVACLIDKVVKLASPKGQLILLDPGQQAAPPIAHSQ